ncbi:coiled-coil domain-containing protein 146 [Sardina pilchardus]|uniref:coiled-coil domain-containing protein 146 n=1 Tax=Sardina pilchardus TaxID=27697 RepID=UPI002E15E2E3
MSVSGEGCVPSPPPAEEEERSGDEEEAAREEEELSDAERELEEEEEEEPISALAPEAGLTQQDPAHSLASPVFQWLDELLSTGKISGVRVAKLKASFSLLQDTLKSSQDGELQLVQECKRFRAELGRQRADLEKAEEFPEGSDSETKRLRQQLLKIHNDLKASEEHHTHTIYQHNDLKASEEHHTHTIYQIECLKEEKMQLEKEYETQPKAVELEKHSKALRESCEELRKEISQRRLEVRSLAEDLEVRRTLLLNEQRELSDKKDIIEIHQGELAQLLSVPGQLGKEIERITRKKAEVQKKQACVEEQLCELSAEQRGVQERSVCVEEERREVLREVEGRRTHTEAAEREQALLLKEHSISKEKEVILLGHRHREQALLLKEHSISKEKEVILLGHRGMLDVSLAQVCGEQKRLHECVARAVRERDRHLRSLKRSELQLRLANNALTHTHTLHLKTKAELRLANNALTHTHTLHLKTKAERDNLPEGDGALQRRTELQKEVDKLKRSLLHQQSVAGVETQLVEQALAQEQELVKETHHQREELRHLACLAQIKADERDQKSREVLRAQQRYNRIKEDLRGKDLLIQEHKKQSIEIQSRLGVFAKMYDIIKGERNKCVTLIQMSSQRSAEMRENLKILENELDILHTTAINKDKLLQKSGLRRVHTNTVRDALHKDISKVACVLQEMRSQRDEQKLSIARLTHLINTHEQQLLHMRKTYDHAVQARNERGVQLLEREEEMCIFYEKVNVQEGVLREGNLELQVLEEEFRGCQMSIKEENRLIGLTRNLLPCKRDLERHSTMLQIQLSESKDRLLALESALEDPKHPSRVRELTGADPSPLELMTKIEEMERRLAEREEQLMERDLVYEQVGRLCHSIRDKATSGSHHTLQLAKKMRCLQGRIKEATQGLMALVAELSMRQASTMTLQQQLRERERELETSQRRLEQGLPPTPDTHTHWLHTLRLQHRQHREQRERAQLEEEEGRSLLPNGVHTTAESRPNAYIAPGDDMPLPKPYGAHAPFLPTEPGANMRHMRKPQPPPIHI